MKNLVLALLSMHCALHLAFCCAMEIHSSSRVKIPLLCIANSADDDMKAITARLQTAFAFSGQFTVLSESTPPKLGKKMRKELYAKG